MEKYEHITKMETIMVQQYKLLKELNQILSTIELNNDKYKKLINYYYSEQRIQDLDADANHLIPETMHRGVLSEDEIDDLIYDRRNTAIRMIEIAVQMIKE